MPYANKRPDSPKGQIYEAFKAKGAEAARKLGEKLGLSAGRVNRWLKDNGAGFQRAAEQHSEAPKPVKKAKAKKPAPKKKKSAAKKPIPTRSGPRQRVNAGEDLVTSNLPSKGRT